MSPVAQRVNTFLLLLLVLMAAAIIGVLATRAGAGPLDPPGPPGSTAGVRTPGTPITAIPYIISQPGYYYLTGNLTIASAADGIYINAQNVTLDLGGFTLDGGSIGTNGVTVGPLAQLVTVRNGHAEHWTGNGFYLLIATAQNLEADRNGNGIELDSGALTQCVAFDNSGTGVYVLGGAIVSNCDAESNTTDFWMQDGELSHCRSRYSTGIGIEVDNLTTVSDCTVASPASDCIVITGGQSDIHDNAMYGCHANGIRDNGTGSLIENNAITYSGTTVLASGIYEHGNDNRIVGNLVTGTHGEGIAADGTYNTIEDNTTSQNSDIGVKIQGVKNTAVKNSSTGNGANYSFDTGNNPGTIDAANAATDPWSNTQ